MPLELPGAPDIGASPTASDIVLKHLRDAIVSGRLAEGAPIRQDDVARLFNVSKIPVREALKRLEAEGFVTFQRNRGAVVAGLSEPEIVEVFELRAVLESHALRLSAPLMSEADFHDAEACARAFAEEHDVSRWAALNWEFHSSLYKAAGRALMMQMIRSLNDRIERYLRVQLTVSGGHDTAVREHAAILSACLSGDIDRAAVLVHDHIMQACRSLDSHLRHGDARRQRPGDAA